MSRAGVAQAAAASAPVSLQHCALMRRDLAEPKRLALHRPSRGERRRRSLRRGIDRWHTDVCARARDKVRVLLLALTFQDPQPIAAQGAIRAFWQAYRKEFGKRPYFSWAELQKRGAVHYHAIFVCPPWRRDRDVRAWVKAHWPHGTLQPTPLWRDDRWFRQAAGRYVKQYAKEPRKDPRLHRNGTSSLDVTVRTPEDLDAGPGLDELDKSYQQDYELLPREIRTWECSRLSELVAVIDQHRSRWDIVNTNPFAPWPIKQLHYWLIGQVLHPTPTPEWCTLAAKQRPLPKLARSGRVRRNAGVTSTSAPWRG